MRNIFAAIMIVIFFGVDSSNAFTVKGTVYDFKTGKPLPGVSVIIEGTRFGAATDISGCFEIENLPESIADTKLVIHLIGYEDGIFNLDGFTHLHNLRFYLNPSFWKFDKVVVTATRRDYILKNVPIMTELITIDEFKNTGALSVNEVLESHVGAAVADDLSGKGISLRGIDPSRVLVLVDGNRVVGRVRGSVDLGQLSLGNVEQIEIVKGTGSTLYGSEAIGGVVNVITKKPSSMNDFNFYTSYGTHNSYDFQGNINTNLIGKGLNLTAKYEHTDGFDLDERTEHTNGLEETDRFNIDQKSVFNIRPGWDIDVMAGFMVEDKNWIETETRVDTVNYDDQERNYRYDLGVRSRWNVKDKANFYINLHGQYYDHKWEKYDRSSQLIDKSITVDDIYEASFQYSRRLSAGHIFTVGGDLINQSLDSDQLASGKESILFGDLYAQYEWRPVSRFVFIPGLRWESHETYGDHLNPSLNAMWDACSFFNLRGSVNRGYRAPSIKELYFEFDHSAAGVKVIGGGEDLDPENSMNYSVTGEMTYSRKAVHRLTYFRNDLKDLIGLGPGDFSDPTYYRGIYTYENILKARTQGMEWETELRLVDDFDLSFSYTYLDAKDLTDDKDLVNRAQHTFKFYTTYNIEVYKSDISFWGFWHNRKLWEAATDAPGSADRYAPSRWNLNLSFGKQLYENIKALFKVYNLTDETSAEFGYWPEHGFTLSLAYNYF